MLAIIFRGQVKTSGNLGPVDDMATLHTQNCNFKSAAKNYDGEMVVIIACYELESKNISHFFLNISFLWSEIEFLFLLKDAITVRPKNIGKRFKENDIF